MDKRQGDREKEKLNRSIQVCVIIILIAGVVLVLSFAMKGFLRQKPDTSQGLQYMKEAEQIDIAKVEKKLRTLERADLRENDTRSLKEKFMGAVVVGDSIAESFEGYNILNSTSVVAKIGAYLSELKGMVGEIKALNPEFIFLVVGNNDVTGTHGDPEAFAALYKDLLDTLKAEIPGVKIYVSSVPPVQPKAIAKDSSLEHIPECNARLQALCEEEGVVYMSNEEVYDEQYYEPDGVHFVADMYTIWAEHMAEVAKL